MGVGVIGSLFFPLLILVLVAVVARWLWLRGGRVREPSCGECGYPVKGLDSLRCPECGADLRVAGIQTSRMRVDRKPGRMALAAGWTIAAAMLGLVATIVVGSLPPVSRPYVRGHFVLQSAANPGPQLRLDMWGTSDGGRNDGATRARILAGSPPTLLPMELARRGDQWIVRSWPPDPALSGAAMNTNVLAEAMRLCGWRFPSPTAGAEVQAVLDLLENGAVSVSGTTGSPPAGAVLATSTGLTFGRQPPAWFLWASAVFWTAVWLAGVMLIMRVRKPRASGEGVARDRAPVPAAAT